LTLPLDPGDILASSKFAAFECNLYRYNTVYAMQIANLMRRSIMRRHLFNWRDYIWEVRDIKGRAEVGGCVQVVNPAVDP
jgi:hypothetical protein